MLSDDVFRRAFDLACRRLVAWSESLGDVASVEQDVGADYLRLALKPHGSTACPVEILLYRVAQAYDVQFGGSQTWEGQPAGADPAELERLLQAVVDGRIVTRQWRSAATGTSLGHAVIVSPEHRASVRFSAGTRNGQEPAEAVCIDRHWAPYRRH